jgi:hypothetical protein
MSQKFQLNGLRLTVDGKSSELSQKNHSKGKEEKADG